MLWWTFTSSWSPGAVSKSHTLPKFLLQIRPLRGGGSGEGFFSCTSCPTQSSSCSDCTCISMWQPSPRSVCSSSKFCARKGRATAPVLQPSVMWGVWGRKVTKLCFPGQYLDLGTALPHLWKEVVYAIKSWHGKTYNNAQIRAQH